MEERGADAVRVSVSSNGVQHLWVGVEPDEALTENDGGSAGSVVVHTHSRVSSAGAGLRGGCCMWPRGRTVRIRFGRWMRWCRSRVT